MYFKTLLSCANHKIAGATCMKANDHITLRVIPLNAICGRDYHFRGKFINLNGICNRIIYRSFYQSSFLHSISQYNS